MVRWFVFAFVPRLPPTGTEPPPLGFFFAWRSRTATDGFLALVLVLDFIWVPGFWFYGCDLLTGLARTSMMTRRPTERGGLVKSHALAGRWSEVGRALRRATAATTVWAGGNKLSTAN